MGNSQAFIYPCGIHTDDVRTLVRVTCESVTSGGVNLLETSGNKNSDFPAAHLIAVTLLLSILMMS